jgi:hypothetical protein
LWLVKIKAHKETVGIKLNARHQTGNSCTCCLAILSVEEEEEEEEEEYFHRWSAPF